VKFILSIILKFYVVVRIEVKLSKEGEFLTGNVRLLGLTLDGVNIDMD